MGEVFRARDKKLQRDVAIKALPDAFGGDAGRLSRFQREAQLLASLNHPNIAHVYGLEESGDFHCIVMELVQGETRAEPRENLPAPPPRRGARGIRVAALLVAAGLAIGIGILGARYLEAPPSELRPQILTPVTASAPEFALAPDGRHLALVASGDGPQRLWLRKLDQIDARPMTGTEGASYPFWSADSRSIGYFASGKLYRINVDGGEPREVADAPSPRDGAWNAAGTIVFAPGQGPLLSISASGGETAPATRLEPGQTSHRFPHFLPDSRHFLFYAQGAPEVGASTSPRWMEESRNVSQHRVPLRPISIPIESFSFEMERSSRRASTAGVLC